MKSAEEWAKQWRENMWPEDYREGEWKSFDDAARAIQTDALETAAKACESQKRKWMSDEFEQCAEAVRQLIPTRP